MFSVLSYALGGENSVKGWPGTLKKKKSFFDGCGKDVKKIS